MTTPATLRPMTSLQSRVLAVRNSCDEASRRAGRDPASVTIVAVSKTVDRAAVDEAWRCGLRQFGENRVAEARDKFASPLANDGVLHMIGQLQSNKAASAVALFDVIQSVDRRSLIVELERATAKQQKSVRLLLQVNVARESQKAGCNPGEIDHLVDLILSSDHLALDGLMAMAPAVADPEETRPIFRELFTIREQLRIAYPGLPLPMLSMGMSSDFEVAIEEGATHVRIGRAIFGG